jgi:spoIIIJ-associated protein
MSMPVDEELQAVEEEEVEGQDDAVTALDPGEVARQFVEDVVQCMGLEATVDAVERDGGYRVEVHGPEVGVLIGRQGSTLRALQYLVTLATARRVGEHVRVSLDAEGYRARREEALRESARQWAQRVRETGQECVLDPMSAMDRRIVHTALADEPGICTYSEGEEPERCVVISPRDSEGGEDPSQEPPEED